MIFRNYILKFKNIFKFLFVFFIFEILFLILASEASAIGASLFLWPASGSFQIGDSFSVEVKVDTAGIPINAAQTILYFPADKLEVKNLSKGDSIFSLWPEEPNFSNVSGKISFVGGLPTPGFTGIGNLITIEFQAKREGMAHLDFGEGKVLADDGKGTNILTFLQGAKYFVQKALPEISLPQIFSPTHPREEEWYNNNNPRFQWKLVSEIIGVSFVLDQNSETIPDEISEGLVQSVDYKGLSDGIWYFHLRWQDKNGWSEPSHYKIQIDSRPPHPFEIIIDNAGDPTNPRPNLYFETTDDTSGISHYKLKIGKADFLDLMLAQINPFSLPSQAPGRWPVLVRAVDMAGNISQAGTEVNIEPIASPQIRVWPKTHISGEEVFYIEGTALPEVELAIFLKKDDEIVKKWQTFSNDQGEWSFSTKELIKSGNYFLYAQAKDQRGALSDFSEAREIKVSFSGILFGPIMITFRMLILIFVLILGLGIGLGGYFIYKTIEERKVLRKETREAKESLFQNFDLLMKEIEKRIELMDTQPGFSEEERKVCQDIKKALEAAQKRVEKEISDIERELK